MRGLKQERPANRGVLFSGRAVAKVFSVLTWVTGESWEGSAFPPNGVRDAASRVSGEDLDPFRLKATTPLSDDAMITDLPFDLFFIHPIYLVISARNE